MARIGLDPTQGPDPVAVIAAYRERAVTLGQLATDVSYLYMDAIELDEAAAKKNLRPVIREPLTTLRSKSRCFTDHGMQQLFTMPSNLQLLRTR